MKLHTHLLDCVAARSCAVLLVDVVGVVLAVVAQDNAEVFDSARRRFLEL